MSRPRGGPRSESLPGFDFWGHRLPPRSSVKVRKRVPLRPAPAAPSVDAPGLVGAERWCGDLPGPGGVMTSCPRPPRVEPVRAPRVGGGAPGWRRRPSRKRAPPPRVPPSPGGYRGFKPPAPHRTLVWRGGSGFGGGGLGVRSRPKWRIVAFFLD